MVAKLFCRYWADIWKMFYAKTVHNCESGGIRWLNAPIAEKM